MSETNKSVLIVDTPSGCRECLFREMAGDFNKALCVPTQKTFDKFIKDKPDWCPLSTLPSYRPYNKDIKRGDARSMTHLITSIHDIGYNECLDAILKGDKYEK